MTGKSTRVCREGNGDALEESVSAHGNNGDLTDTKVARKFVGPCTHERRSQNCRVAQPQRGEETSASYPQTWSWAVQTCPLFRVQFYRSLPTGENLSPQKSMTTGCTIGYVLRLRMYFNHPPSNTVTVNTFSRPYRWMT